MQKIRLLVEDALTQGASLETGSLPDPNKSLFVEPIVLTGVSAQMKIWTTEIFGPVIATRSFEREEQAIAMANDTPFGLAAYVWTQNARRCWQLPEVLQYGMVGLNTGSISTAQAPFGGVKQSGMGREGGHHGLQDYLQYKYICQSL